MRKFEGRFYSVLLIVVSISIILWHFYKLDSNISNFGTLLVFVLSIICLFFYLKALLKIHDSEFYPLKTEDENLHIHNDIIYNESSYFIKNSFINNNTKNINQTTNNFIKQIVEKEKKNNRNVNSKNAFDNNFIIEITNLIKEINIKEIKHFSILIYFIKEKFYPLETDVWLLGNFKSFFKITINNQYFSTVKNELDEINGLKDLSKLTRAQKKSYTLLQNIENYFNVKNHE